MLENEPKYWYWIFKLLDSTKIVMIMWPCMGLRGEVVVEDY